MKKLLLILSFISLPIFSMEVPKEEREPHKCARVAAYTAFATAYVATIAGSTTVGICGVPHVGLLTAIKAPAIASAASVGTGYIASKFPCPWE